MPEPQLDSIERLLLMAAELEGLGPDTDLGIANAAKPCNRVLRWLGLNPDEVRDGWWTPPERPGPPLFEGGSDWGAPATDGRPANLGAWPQYKSCRLTPLGQSIARRLLADQPENRRAAP